jgi:thiamine pyrophosphokinase
MDIHKEFIGRDVILANGQFPQSRRCMEILAAAERVICCDGAAGKLISTGIKPWAIVGDMDSLSAEAQARHSAIIYSSSCQETNDLTKAITFCASKGIAQACILGATGLRDDHAIANIFLLPSYQDICPSAIITEAGIFTAHAPAAKLNTAAGMQVSVFATSPLQKFSSAGLKYKLSGPLPQMWQGTLNQATGKHVSIEASTGSFIVFRLASQ